MLEGQSGALKKQIFPVCLKETMNSQWSLVPRFWWPHWKKLKSTPIMATPR